METGAAEAFLDRWSTRCLRIVQDGDVSPDAAEVSITASRQMVVFLSFITST
jgi:hypothetical protein